MLASTLRPGCFEVTPKMCYWLAALSCSVACSCVVDEMWSVPSTLLGVKIWFVEIQFFILSQISALPANFIVAW